MTDASTSATDAREERRNLAFAGRLVQAAPSLLRRGEVIACAALFVMLDHPALRAVFESHIEIHPNEGSYWVTEDPVVEGELKGRIDLVRRDASGLRQVVVEAKLAHHMSTAQLELYASSTDVLRTILLVPAHRRPAAQGVLDDMSKSRRATAKVVTWEEIFRLFEDTSRKTELAGDVEQFAALVRALARPILEPFGDATPQQLIEQRLDDLEVVVNHVTLALQDRYAPGKRPLTLQRDRDRIFVLRRHVEVIEGGTNLALGIVEHEPDAGILWVRYHKDTPGFSRLDRQAIADHRTVRDWDDHLWVAVPLPRSPDPGEMVQHLADEVTDIHQRLTRTKASLPHPTPLDLT